ncbi:hypothetical protein [Wolbachia endosymbiont (group A) of Rhorus exstirpatorius]
MKGRKRHIIVDTIGLIIRCMVPECDGVDLV